MTGKLESLFLNFRAADEDAEELEDELKEEIERLTNVIGEWSRHVGGLPHQRHPGHIISACDEAISQALRAIADHDYETAYDCLQIGRSAVADIQKAWEANLSYEAAQVAYEALAESLTSNRLKPLLTLQNLTLLLDETAALLRRGKYRQGELLGQACRHRSALLSERHQTAVETLHDRLKHLRALCDEVAPFVPRGQTDWADQTALRAVAALIHERHYALAERLLDDLEVELTPHRTFIALYKQLQPETTQAHAAQFVSDVELQERIAAQSWSAATSYLLSRVIEQLTAQAAAVPSKAASLQQRIALYQTSPASAQAGESK
jgi:hypothetical protein